jgi:hypothetical protein
MIPHLSTAAIGAPISRLGVSFFPIYLPENELQEIKTGPSSELVVRELEDAAVDSLLAVNPTGTPVLIVEGEHFLGGKQNRAVNITVLVPPRTELPIPVSCLEEGRWGRAVSYYRDDAYASPRVRRRSQEGVHSSMEQSRSRHGDQGAVWNEVHHEMRSHEAYSDTVAAADSAKHVYSHDTDRAEAAQELADLGPLPRQCGVAVSHGPWVTAVELFGARHLLAEHWGALIRSHLLELPPEFRPPSVERALWVVRRFGAMQPQESPSVGLGFELRVRDQKRIGQALTLDGMLAHGSFWMRNGRRI